MPEIKEVLAAGAQQLAQVGIETARLDSEVLLAETLKISRSDLMLGRYSQTLTDHQKIKFEHAIARRKHFEPIAYILGYREFWSLDFAVGPGALIPRGDSEVLIETAINLFKNNAPEKILDLGTGPGTLLLSALSEFPDAHGLGIDSCAAALGFAQRNAAALGLADRAVFQLGNWAQGLTQTYDLILCNPPYIAADTQLMPDVQNFEPAAALFAGNDGMAAYNSIVPNLPSLLRPGGAVLVELGHDQAAAFAQLAHAHGFVCTFRPDLAGHLRCAILQLA